MITHRLASKTVNGSANADTMTIDVCFYSGEPVDRFDWYTGQNYQLQFATDFKAVDLSRLNAGAPVLNAHDASDIDDQIGVVLRAWLDGGKCYATLKFSDREEVVPVWRDIQNGIIRNVSMGAATLEEQDVTDKKTGQRTVTVTRWQPMEISVVPIPADAGAQFLAADDDRRLLARELRTIREQLAALKFDPSAALDQLKPYIDEQIKLGVRLALNGR